MTPSEGSSRSRLLIGGRSARKPLSRPAEGRPQGSGLDNGVAKTSPATWRKSPARGSWMPRCLARSAEDPMPIRRPRERRTAALTACGDGLALRVEEGPDVLGGLLVLARDGVGVVTGHVDRRPAEPGLLLALGDHGVEGGGLEVPERMQVEVLGELGCIPGLGEGSWLMESGCGGTSPSRLGRRRRSSLAPRSSRRPSASRSCSVAQPFGAAAKVLCRSATTRMLARVFGDLTTAPPLRRHDGLIDRDGAALPVDVRPPQCARLAAACASRRDHAQAGGESRGRARRPSPGAAEPLPSTGHRTGSGHLVDAPRRKLRVRDRVRQRAVAPLACEPAGPVEDGLT